MEKLPFYKILVEADYVSQGDWDVCEKRSLEKNISITDCLISSGVLSKDILGQATAEFFKLEYADLNTIKPGPELVTKIDKEFAMSKRIILFAEDDNRVYFATDRPFDSTIPYAIRDYLVDKRDFEGKTIKVLYGLSEDIDELFGHYRQDVDKRISELADDDQSASKTIDIIVEEAITQRASDIHLEPQPKGVIVRYRVDGVLRDIARITHGDYEGIVNRLKILAKLRIDERLQAQDGSIQYDLGGKTTDLRISIVPILDGEKIVIRVLSKYIRNYNMNDLGLDELAINTLQKTSKRPFGMIIVSGPTGSGKTTTLYSILNFLNNPDINITTIEDPVEYKTERINQIQVNTSTGLTFAKGLRTIVRQDPDVILVGEIRDRETAEIAVNAALTGHLLLTTFHANDSSTTIPRLIDMGIDPFLLSSTISLIIAQRLARVICENCKVSYEVSKKELAEKYPQFAKHISKDNITLFEGQGCEKCKHTGYSGRIGLFEIIKISSALQPLINAKASAKEIWVQAQKDGALPMYDDGVKKVIAGLTTVEEIERVTNVD